MGANFTQLFPPAPSLTEKNLPSQVGKVFIVTGGNAGIGYELAKILYLSGATVYIAGRSPQLIATAIEEIQSIPTTTSPGILKSLHLDLGDLNTIRPCVSTFLAQESRLDVLWNNAGIAQVPVGTKTTQGHEAHIGVNCLGPFLLTKLLLPILLTTARSTPKASTRIVFTSSGIVDLNPVPGGLILNDLATGTKDKALNYSVSKAGNWFLASEFHKRTRYAGIVSLVHSPGSLKTKSWNNVPWLKMLFAPLLYEAKFGAYTELWVGLSEQVGVEDGGRFAIPWGRWHPSPRKDVLMSLKTKDEGGTGLAGDFWEWCEERTRDYL